MTAGAIVGVLLAAGRSRRMGTAKQLLPWPDSCPPTGSRGTIVEASFDLLSPFCARLVVVLDHQAELVRRVLGERPFTPILGDGGAPMFESVRLGLRAALDVDAAANVLLHPVDHPAVAPSTVRRLLDEGSRRSDRAVVPVHGGRGGHPVLIPPALCRGILDHDGRDGLRGFWRSHADSCWRLPVDDPWVVADVDTPEDYRALQARLGG